jgi:hypothetical protein
MHNQSMIKQWLRDSAVAFLLIVAGILISRLLTGWLPVRGSIGHLCCFLIAEIPFAWFLGMRRGFFRWWEYVGFFACIVAMILARDRLVQLGASHMLVTGIVPGIIFGCFICFHQAIRSHLTALASEDRASSG